MVIFQLSGLYCRVHGLGGVWGKGLLRPFTLPVCKATADGEVLL